MTDLPIRPDLVGRTPYGAPQIDVPIKLNTNENPFEHAESFVKSVTGQIEAVLKQVNRYPDRDAVELRIRLAEYLSNATKTSIEMNQIWAANGSNEILMQLFQLFGGPERTAIGFEPSYSMHHIISELTNTKWISLNRDENYEIEESSWAKEIANADLVLICTPNNPTGNVTELDVVKRIHDKTNGIVIVDEAYAEFSERPSATTLIQSCPRLAVVRTMSKAFGFAGVRLGYVAASTQMITALQLVRLPYHLSSLTQQAAISALDTASDLHKQVQLIISERNRISLELQDMGLKVINSEANFILFGEFEDQTAVWDFLLKQGILVRDVGISGWLRVTCGSPSENSAFLKALKEFLEPTPRQGS